MDQTYNRAEEDLGNIIALEHVNLLTPDQRLATLFYITGMGFTRDPYLVTGVTNMWVNVGLNQFHLPTGEAQRLRGCTGVVVPDLAALAGRLEKVRRWLDGTDFDFAVHADRIDVTSPWGNRIRCHGPSEQFGRSILGIPYVELDVPVGTADGIARFYREILMAPATVDDSGGTPTARVGVGDRQSLVFRETSAALADYDGHHIQIYVVNFSGPHGKLLERGLITEESDQHQYRFVDITDPDTGDVLYALEHEVRSMTHPLRARRLINRNPEMSNTSFAQGYDDAPWLALPEA